MEYIVAERIGRTTHYIEEYYRGDTMYLTEEKSEAHRFGLTDATSIAQKNGMYIEEAE